MAAELVAGHTGHSNSLAQNPHSPSTPAHVPPACTGRRASSAAPRECSHLAPLLEDATEAVADEELADLVPELTHAWACRYAQRTNGLHGAVGVWRCVVLVRVWLRLLLLLLRLMWHMLV